MIHPERIAEVIGGAAILGSEVRSLQDLQRSVSRGLPKTALRRTVEQVYTTAGDVRAAIHRVLPEATFKRRIRLSQAEGERTERLARVIAAAEFVWVDPDDAREWLTKPHLLNPRHQDFTGIRTTTPEPVFWDSRLFAER